MFELRKVLTRSDEDEAGAADEAPHYDYTGRHVLLVEDNELNREIAAAILEETGSRLAPRRTARKPSTSFTRHPRTSATWSSWTSKRPRWMATRTPGRSAR